MGGASSDSSCSYVPFSSQILLRLGAVLPDNTNLFAGVLVWAVATSLVTLGYYTFMNFAHVAAEVELDAFHTASCAINALRCDLVGMIHLTPFTRNLLAQLVIIFNSSKASLTGLAINATACNHFIHSTKRFIFFANIVIIN
jgi:hypothetical protein